MAGLLFVFVFCLEVSLNNEPYDDGIGRERWAKIRPPCEKRDVAKATNAMADAGIDPRAYELFCIALAYTREAAETEKAAEGMHEIRRDTAEELRMLRSAQPISVDESRRIRAEIKELQGKHDRAIFAIEAARLATIRLRGLTERLPGLFGVEKPLPVMSDVPAAYRIELERVGLPDIRDPWRHLNPLRALVEPSKRYTTADTFSQIRVS